MLAFIRRIEIIGLYSRFDIVQEFQSGANIIYGRNGTYKTTLLHVIANALNGEFERFVNLSFNCINIKMSNGKEVSLKWRKDNKTLVVTRSDQRRAITEIFKDHSEVKTFQITGFSNSSPLPSAAYFPTFRTMLEAWMQAKKNNFNLLGVHERTEHLNDSTSFARQIFGEFVPRIDYLSLPDIMTSLSTELTESALAMAKLNRELLSRSFTDIFDIFSSNSNLPFNTNSDDLIKEIEIIHSEIQSYPLQTDLSFTSDIRKKFEQILDFTRLGDRDSTQVANNLLFTYKNLLAKILDELKKHFSRLINYIQSVNRFLENKRIEISSKDNEVSEPFVQLVFDTFSENYAHAYTLVGDGELSGLKFLSSGERQIITLIYAAHISSQEVILIDEPEISLHVDWQEVLLVEMEKQLQGRQIIACTHSPMIGANYEDQVMELLVMNTNEELWTYAEPNIVGQEDEDDKTDEFLNDSE